jgi:hypothetical protein
MEAIGKSMKAINIVHPTRSYDVMVVVGQQSLFPQIVN